MPEPPHPWLSVQRERHAIESLPIDERSVAHLSRLEPHHRDPFDRLFLCQAMEHGPRLITADAALFSYPVDLLLKV